MTEVRTIGAFRDLTGQRFGRLIVIEQAGHDDYRKYCGGANVTVEMRELLLAVTLGMVVASLVVV